MSIQLELPFPPEYVVIKLSKFGKNRGKYTTIVSSEDADLDKLNWAVKSTKRSKTKYVQRREVKDGTVTLVALHHIIMQRVLGRELSHYEQIDHIDGNGLNNTRENLRIATGTQNIHNRERVSKSGLKGVSYNKKFKRWYAEIQHKKTRYAIGFFDTSEEAHTAYCRKADELYGEFANYEGKTA